VAPSPRHRGQRLARASERAREGRRQRRREAVASQRHCDQVGTVSRRPRRGSGASWLGADMSSFATPWGSSHGRPRGVQERMDRGARLGCPAGRLSRSMSPGSEDTSPRAHLEMEASTTRCRTPEV
jgi:hypothetical protein